MSRINRLTKIAKIIIRYRLDTLIERDELPTIVKLLLAPWRLVPVPQLSRGERLRLSLEALGPIFVKFGQALSTRSDLLPDDIITEMEKLQDQVPPFPQQQAINIIENGLGQPIDKLFAEFTAEPMASASVAQVHAATLHSGEKVVVKVVRPDIEKVIRLDIKLMFSLAKLITRYLPYGRRLRPVEVVDDYQHTILDELDLQREGANTSQLRRNFADSDMLYVPEVYWDYTRRNILTMERIHGIPVTDIPALQQQNTNMQVLAERGVEIFFTQVFRDSFFHADMHPGNVFVSRENPEAPKYIAIDCAIIGSLSESDQYYLARNLLAIFQRNYHQVAELHLECGWIPADTAAHEFESAIRTVCEPIFEKPIGEISFGQLLVHLFQTGRRFDMEVQPSLVLLQKTLLNIEGLGRQLYPQLDLWTTAQPFLEQWVKDRYSPDGLYKRVSKLMPAWLEQLPALPDALMDVAAGGNQKHEVLLKKQQQIEHLEQQIEERKKSKRLAGISLLLIIAAIIPANPDLFEQIPIASWVLLAAATAFWLKR